MAGFVSRHLALGTVTCQGLSHLNKCSNKQFFCITGPAGNIRSGGVLAQLRQQPCYDPFSFADSTPSTAGLFTERGASAAEEGAVLEVGVSTQDLKYGIVEPLSPVAAAKPNICSSRTRCRSKLLKLPRQ